MPETCDEPDCTEAPVFTLTIMRRNAPDTIPYFLTEHRDVCADHASFTPNRVEDSVRVEAYTPLSHHRLLRIVKRLPEDYQSFGLVDGDQNPNGMGYADCSGGCRFYATLEGKLGMDWGCCVNPKSHRAGLLTFEHQGCYHFEADPHDDE